MNYNGRNFYRAIVKHWFSCDRTIVTGRKRSQMMEGETTLFHLSRSSAIEIAEL